jgi:hypothetical protein
LCSRSKRVQLVWQQAAIPLAIAVRWICIEQCQNSLFRLLVVSLRFIRPAASCSPASRSPNESLPPLGTPRQTRLQSAGDLPWPEFPRRPKRSREPVPPVDVRRLQRDLRPRLGHAQSGIVPPIVASKYQARGCTEWPGRWSGAGRSARFLSQFSGGPLGAAAAVDNTFSQGGVQRSNWTGVSLRPSGRTLSGNRVNRARQVDLALSKRTRIPEKLEASCAPMSSPVQLTASPPNVSLGIPCSAWSARRTISAVRIEAELLNGAGAHRNAFPCGPWTRRRQSRTAATTSSRVFSAPSPPVGGFQSRRVATPAGSASPVLAGSYCSSRPPSFQNARPSDGAT